MDLKERENNRRNSVVSSIISDANANVDSAIESSKGGINKKGEKESFKPKSYYLSEELYKALGLKAALTGVDKSEIVRQSLTIYLKDILDEYSDALK